MEVPRVFADITQDRRVGVRDLFFAILDLERRQASLWGIHEVCQKISKKPYIRTKDFDDLSRLIFFNIGKGKAINPCFRAAVFFFLQSVNPMYLADFFGFLDLGTFGRMRIIFSDDELLKIFAKMSEENIFFAIENEGLRHEIKRFIEDSNWPKC